MDIIYALSTAPGKSGIAIIRISGLDLSIIFKMFDISKDIKPRYANLCKLYHPHDKMLLDNAIIIWFPSPNSFTGEDVIEFHIHGSKSIINSVLEAISIIPGTRIADGGEFSKRAFLNNKIDLIEAEALEDLINSETRSQQNQALRQMSGDLSRLYNNWRDKLIRTLALIEAYIDFPDENIPEDIKIEISETIAVLIKEIDNHIDDNRIGEKLREGIFITIIGAPNVGKSSLLNFLAKKDIAIVSNIAGTTRDVIEIKLDIAGVPVTIADTAGIRETDDFIEKEGVKRAIARAHNSDFNIAIFDSTKLPEMDESTMSLINKDTIILFNKADLIDGIKIIDNSINISIKEEIGMDEFIDKLKSVIHDIFTPSSDPVITRIRYRENLISCLGCLYNFSFDLDIEIAAEEIRLAASFIGKIMGKIDIEIILDEIFSSFCIGK